VEIWADDASEENVVLQPPEPGLEVAASSIVGKRILLVDDDIRTLLNLTPTLEAWGLEVTAAGDGIEALEVLQEDDEFALVLMDILMPKLDGYDTIRRIREHQRFSNLAILALTAKTDKADCEACLEAGANGFLTKPVDTKELKRVIEQHFT